MVPTCCTHATGWPVEEPTSGYPSFNSFKHMAVQDYFKFCIFEVNTGAKLHN
jgi:hypothetical protein